jgi:hypothetical protein
MSLRRLSYDSRKMNREGAKGKVEMAKCERGHQGEAMSFRVSPTNRGISQERPLQSLRSVGVTGRSRPWIRALLPMLLLAGSAFGSLCVWRQPDTDISSIFGSGSYKTVFADITDAQKKSIEKRIGFSLDADETQFKYFPVFKGKKRVGTVMTHAGKGQFGAIEIVVAVVDGDSGPVIREVRIQRDREKAKAALRSKDFLGQFKGMSVSDDFRVTSDGPGIRTAVKGAEKASQAVATAARKLLIVYDELGRP